MSNSPFGKKVIGNRSLIGEQFDFARLLVQAADARLTLPVISSNEFEIGQTFYIKKFFVKETVNGKKIILILNDKYQYYLPNRIQMMMLPYFMNSHTGDTSFYMRFEGISSDEMFPIVNLAIFLTQEEMNKHPFPKVPSSLPVNGVNVSHQSTTSTNIVTPVVSDVIKSNNGVNDSRQSTTSTNIVTPIVSDVIQGNNGVNDGRQFIGPTNIVTPIVSDVIRGNNGTQNQIYAPEMEEDIIDLVNSPPPTQKIHIISNERIN